MSRAPLAVALVWHMHQPYYRDDVAGEFVLPWVRRRAAKDYLHMLTMLERHPAVRVTMNMVPSLLAQLEIYAAGGFADADRDLCLRDAADLTNAERRFLVSAALRNHYGRRVAVLAPLMALLDELRDSDAAEASTAQLRDLQVWSLLGWIDPGDIAADAELHRLAVRGRGFAEADKAAVDERQLALLARVIPSYRAAVLRGQVEPMTSPLHHPILPLLLDPTSARVADPAAELADPPLRAAADAAEQVRRGLAAFERITGAAAAGMWPPECAVSPAAAQLMHDCGVTYAVSDEGVLARTLAAAGGADVRASGALHRSHRERSGLDMVFRDAELSNLIGFSYQLMDAEAAVADLIGRLERIAETVRDAADDGPQLVTLALDGENFKDFYAENGTPFLDALYTRLAGSDRLVTTGVGAFLAEHPDASSPLPPLWTGSWIDADLRTWAGSPPATRAWRLLGELQGALETAGGAEAHPRAHEELLIAEGSDWFWWFGPHHDSGADEAWDELFRAHVRNAYELAGLTAPAAVDEPVLDGDGLSVDCAPLRHIDPVGRGPGEWACAGSVEVGAAFGAMRPPASSVERVQYGAGGGRLHLRFGDRAPRFERAVVDAGALGSLVLTQPTRTLSVVAPIGQVIELSVSLEEPGRGVERAPARGSVRLSVSGAAPLRVAMVAAECAPLAVAGELAGTVAATARAAAALGHDVLVVIPHHRDADPGLDAALRLPALLGQTGDAGAGRVLQGRLPGSDIPVLSVDLGTDFERESIYGAGDDGARYLRFCAAAAEALAQLGFAPDLVHGFEWQTGALLAAVARGERPPATVFSAGPGSPAHWVDAALASAAGLGDGGADLLEVGRRAAVVGTATEPGELAELYRRALRIRATATV